MTSLRLHSNRTTSAANRMPWLYFYFLINLMLCGLSQKQKNHCPTDLTEFCKRRSQNSTMCCTATSEALGCQLHCFGLHHVLPFGFLTHVVLWALLRELSFKLFATSSFLGSSPWACFWPFFRKFSFGLFVLVSFWDFWHKLSFGLFFVSVV